MKMNTIKQLTFINSTSFRGWPQSTATFLNQPGWTNSQLHLMRMKSNNSDVPPSNSDYGRQLGGFEYKEGHVDSFRINVNDSHLELKNQETNRIIRFSFEWLRENCRCKSCYNSVTNQRNICIFDINPNVRPKSCNKNGSTLVIEWEVGHFSSYNLDWLVTQSEPERRPSEMLWSGDISGDVEYVTGSEIKTKDGITRLVKSLLVYGVGFVTNVDPDLRSTEEVIRCVGPPQQTLFGGMWQFSDSMDHLDTAYTNLALGAHTDTSYFIEPAGLIIFHCIKRNCTGGKTLLVDGFRAAKEVQEEAPELYKGLRTINTEFQYIEKGHHLTSLATIIHHTPNDKINQIRYNLYDRSARLPLPASECGWFYRAVRQLATALGRPTAQWWLTLEPGSVVFINNWRVLHGRSAYTGQRTITGAYVSMGNLLSRARCLGLIR